MASGKAAPETANSVPLPTGTVTFLFSDIEGSTQRWDTHPEAMKEALAHHERIVSDAMLRHGGYVFKIIGDAFCVAFPTAPGAVRAAADAQRALAQADFSAVGGLRVRIGLHTGSAQERNADYFGPAVNRTARLMGIGHGGQVLVSGATRELALAHLPIDTTLVDLGSQRLRDLAEPERVWQLNVAGLPAGFPPLQSLDNLPNNLPIEPTSFIGRERDVREVKELLGRHRLLTLVGSGGVGKTRLALQVGAELLDRNRDGVWFADFAPITDPELVASVTAQALGMTQQEGKRVDESIPPWLRRKQLLLILDNCEHVLETVASLAASILHAAQDVCILNTSRQVLGIRGEEVFRLPSLEVPHEIADLTPAAIAEFGAVALFVDRAKSVNKSFALTQDTAPIVAEICGRLDGIPLAIELAAARVKVLSIPNLGHRINERFKILTGGSRDALPRQKTLGALIDWSYDLLSAQEQTLFNRLGIFAGGFDLEAATRVCGGGLDEIDVLDVLGSLADKSLVVADTSGERERYHLLESMRAYALERLGAAVERDQLAHRHLQYFRALAERADDRYGTSSTIAWLAKAEIELENDRAALEWSLTQGRDAVSGGALAAALGRLWRGRGLDVEGRYWVEQAFGRVTESEQPRIVARLLTALGRFLYGKQMYGAAERAMRLYESLGDVRSAAREQSDLGFVLNQMGRLDESDEAVARALAVLRECGDRFGVVRCLNYQGQIAHSRGDFRAARESYEQAIAAFAALGDETAVARTRLNVAETEFADGHPEAALRFVTGLLEQPGYTGSGYEAVVANVNAALYRIALGDLAGAEASAREGLRLARQIRDEQNIAIALQHFALLSALGGDVRRAARVLGYVDAQYEALDTQRERTEQWGYEILTAALRAHLSEDEIAKLAAEGAARTEERLVDEALKTTH